MKNKSEKISEANQTKYIPFIERNRSKNCPENVYK